MRAMNLDLHLAAAATLLVFPLLLTPPPDARLLPRESRAEVVVSSSTPPELVSIRASSGRRVPGLSRDPVPYLLLKQKFRRVPDILREHQTDDFPGLFPWQFRHALCTSNCEKNKGKRSKDVGLNSLTSGLPSPLF